MDNYKKNLRKMYKILEPLTSEEARELLGFIEENFNKLNDVEKEKILKKIVNYRFMYMENKTKIVLDLIDYHNLTEEQTDIIIDGLLCHDFDFADEIAELLEKDKLPDKTISKIVSYAIESSSINDMNYKLLKKGKKLPQKYIDILVDNIIKCYRPQVVIDIAIEVDWLSKENINSITKFALEKCLLTSIVRLFTNCKNLSVENRDSIVEFFVINKHYSEYLELYNSGLLTRDNVEKIVNSTIDSNNPYFIYSLLISLKEKDLFNKLINALIKTKNLFYIRGCIKRINFSINDDFKLKILKVFLDKGSEEEIYDLLIEELQVKEKRDKYLENDAFSYLYKKLINKLIGFKNLTHLVSLVIKIENLNSNTISKIVDIIIDSKDKDLIIKLSSEAKNLSISDKEKLTNAILIDDEHMIKTKIKCDVNNICMICEYFRKNTDLSVDTINDIIDAIIEFKSPNYICIIAQYKDRLNKDQNKKLEIAILETKSLPYIAYFIYTTKNINLVYKLFNSKENYYDYCINQSEIKFCGEKNLGYNNNPNTIIFDKEKFEDWLFKSDKYKYVEDNISLYLKQEKFNYKKS